MKHRLWKSGFTLVELLVVITIIGILIALLLPAVQAAREAARRMQCSNNFRQVGIAMHSYLSALRCFPPGLFMHYPGDPCAPATTNQYFGWGWGTYILPYMEVSGLYDQIHFQDGSWSSPYNFKVQATFVTTYICPSAAQGKDLVHAANSMQNGADPLEDEAITYMAGVADSRSWDCLDGSGNYTAWVRRDGDGILFESSNIDTGQISDGTSNTLLVGEVIGDGPGTHRGFFWTTWDILDTHNGINNPLKMTMPCGYWDSNCSGFASYHPGGCNFVLADGSVHFISENISSGVRPPNQPPSVLQALTTRAKGDVVNQIWD